VYRQGPRWKIVVRHHPDCDTRVVPSRLWLCNGRLIDAAFGDGLAATGEECEVAHRVAG
jgi:hypothetical protein